MRPSLRQLPLHPLLLAAYAVLFLYGQNVQLVRTSEVASPLGWSILGAALVLVVAALVLRDLARGAVVASALVVAFFGYGHLARLADDPPAELLVAFWLIVIAAATVVAIRLRDSRAAATVGLNAVSFVLVLFALSTIMPHLLQPSAQARAQAGDAPPSGLTARRATQRDIYYLVFDRYGSQSALAPELGITDNDLPGWLAERGFQTVPNAHANYVRTTLSLASALNMEHLDRVAARQGPTSTDYGPLYTMLQEHQVG
ncbi:MAG TPA: hypothetical protein VK992_02550, partial [Candidatus Caenarcaniphilales bacterium]|nr:hypothetical protein [Candidatus Caenarcaniphilales bacterium]